MKKVLLIGVVLLAGCGPPMTDREVVLFGLMIGAQTADGVTTARNIHAGGTELNPFLSDRPNDGSIALFKLATSGLLWGLGEIDSEHREFFYTVGIISGTVAASWNVYQYDQR